jgi:hypothetical protein
MKIKFPKSGWIKPAIRETEYSIDVSLNPSGGDPRKFEYLYDIIHFFGRDAFELELKYSNRKTNSVESKRAVISFITVSVTESGNKVYDVQATSFEKLDEKFKISLKQYLEKFTR